MSRTRVLLLVLDLSFVSVPQSERFIPASATVELDQSASRPLPNNRALSQRTATPFYQIASLLTSGYPELFVETVVL